MVLHDSPIILARRKETPFIMRALCARTREEFQIAMNEGRVAMETSRRVSRESRKK